jgi:hypothetical protein
MDNPKVHEALKEKLAKLIIASAIDGPVEIEDDDVLLDGMEEDFDESELESIEEEVNEALESASED